MQEFEEERLSIKQHTIDMKPIYKQLKFKTDPVAAVVSAPSKPNHYNAFVQSKSMIKSSQLNERNLTTTSFATAASQNKSLSKVFGMELSTSTVRGEENAKGKLKKGLKGYMYERKNTAENDTELKYTSMSSVFKKNTLTN